MPQNLTASSCSAIPSARTLPAHGRQPAHRPPLLRRQPTPAASLFHVCCAQLAHLSAAEYQGWLLRTSRGKARFFKSDRLEALTKVKW